MSTEAPAWRRLFDRVERTIGEPLERVTADARFAELLLLVLETWNAFARMGRSMSTEVFHLVNLPTHDDLRRLERRLGGLQKQLLDLTATIERFEKAGAP
jgi:hypothetical protein